MFPHSSSISYVLVISSGHVLLSETSDIWVTVGTAVQLSETPVTSAVFTAGTSAEHWTLTAPGAVAKGAILSLTVITCVTWKVFPQSSSIS